ncbi:hypothetical protein DPMN_080770 [Dreissena polymorpha]|uniref:Uncharacterized protein n=1 Tax=Dreissena polymorpha TaxID=45954 RepID=A0A9D4BS08_DREPO|nr:hypothetical protein DPMN_080770 [Dreissena polymorpha]
MSVTEERRYSSTYVRTVVALRTVLSAPFIHVVRIRREFSPLLRGRRIELRLKKALKHDTSFVVWSSTPFDSQPEVNQNSNSALNNIREASISAQLLSFRACSSWGQDYLVNKSTSIDIELAQQPHQSRLQEPQSRTTLPLP